MADGFDSELAGIPAKDEKPKRRLSDKILLVFEHSCEIGEFDVAQQLLVAVETIFAGQGLNPDQDRRKNFESLVSAYERLWVLKHGARNNLVEIEERGV